MMDQVRKALRLLRPSITNDEIVEEQKRIMLDFANLPQKDAPYYGQLIYNSIAEYLGEDDPYKDIKRKYNEIALGLLPRLKEMVDKSENRLLTAFTISIMGNCIDLGTPHTIDIEGELKNYGPDSLKINHFDRLKADLDNHSTRLIFIIGDNCGEIVFDKILVEELKRLYPDKRIVYGVRGGPAINDATLEDAKAVGMTDLVEVVEGSRSPGVILEQASPEFREVFENADLIISKGQGNFESLDNVESDAPIYFLLKTKCQPVADMFGVPLGSLVLYRRKGPSDFE